jgi:hypothetical protein
MYDCDMYASSMSFRKTCSVILFTLYAYNIVLGLAKGLQSS